ncbi:MAG: FixH family protein [Burkholderiaceae bacterium]
MGLTSMNQDASAKPWYREPWPWIIMSGPAIVVVAGITTGIIAARGFDGPTAADYYKEGLSIDRDLSRAQKGSALGVEATAQFSGINDGDAVRVSLSSREPMPPEAALQVRLVHPGKRELDRVAILSRLEAAADGRSAVFSGRWRASETLESGSVAWTVVLETQAWRVDDSLKTGTGGEFRIGR